MRKIQKQALEIAAFDLHMSSHCFNCGVGKEKKEGGDAS